MDGHRAAIMCDKHSVLLRTQSKDLRVLDSGMKAKIWSSLEVNRYQPLGGPKDVFVQIVVGLKPDFHSTGLLKRCFMRCLIAAPFG